MNISMKDLKTILIHMKMVVHSDKKYIKKLEESNRQNSFYDCLKRRVEDLEPIISELEKGMNNIKIPIIDK